MPLVADARASFDTSERRVSALRAALAKETPRAYGPDDSLQFDALKSRMVEIRATL